MRVMWAQQDFEAALKAARATGWDISRGALAELLRGLAAAPDFGRRDWTTLVHGTADDALLDLLDTLRAQAAQAFEESSVPKKDRLGSLRAAMADQGLSGFVVPHADEYQNEFIPLRAERLAWLTGFTGSAGTAVILADKAAIFVDGRYTLQVREQVDSGSWEICSLTDDPPHAWIERNLPRGARLGYDPWLHTPAQTNRLCTACDTAGGVLVSGTVNPLDVAWSDQPPPPVSPVVPHATVYTGKSGEEKRTEILGVLREKGEDAVVLTAPESVAWLLNIRGADVSHTPLVLCRAILLSDGTARLFLDPAKVTDGLQTHLGNAVAIENEESFGPALDGLGARGCKVRLDRTTAPTWVDERLRQAGAVVVDGADPCVLPKACKTRVEVDGTRAAHRRDGAALVRFLHWLSEAAPGGSVTELSAAARLQAIRLEDGLLRDLSFATISAAGPHAALPHYRVTAKSNRPLASGDIYLVDSGGQYLDGTTDVTRTVAIGPADPEARRRFTLVLKGHIALARAVFPEGTTGTQLDPLARQFLWAEGLDYDHGTGHGVGSFLGVHEGPARISKAPSPVALRPGMVLSNEPGYYKEGAYGIRIENLVTVVAPEQPANADRSVLAFETLTLAPIDRTLIDPALLTAEETAWLNAYHQRVCDTLTPLLEAYPEVRAWLAGVTAPV